jgi:hypothetical protein
MKAIELIGDIDEQHRLRARVPEELPAGPKKNERGEKAPLPAATAGMGWPMRVMREPSGSSVVRKVNIVYQLVRN